MDLETFKSMDNEEIIKIVAENIKKDYDSFDIALFDTIQVKERRNPLADIEEEEQDELSYWVSFQMSIRYIPQNSCYIYAIGNDPVIGLSSKQTVCNPIGYKTQEELKFFIPTEESKKAVSFVIEPLKKADIEISEDGKLPEETTLNIRDNSDHYGIELLSTWWDYSCKIDKNSGGISDEVQGDLEPDEE